MTISWHALAVLLLCFFAAVYGSAPINFVLGLLIKWVDYYVIKGREMKAEISKIGDLGSLPPMEVQALVWRHREALLGILVFYGVLALVLAALTVGVGFGIAALVGMVTL